MSELIKKFTLDSIGEFLQQYAERSENVFWLSSPDFQRIVYISPAYEKIWQRKIKDLYNNPTSWLDALVLDPGQEYNPIASMAEKIAQEGPNARFEETYRIWCPNGEIRWIMDHGFPIYDLEGNCCGVTGVATDITASKEIEFSLEAAKLRAEIANKSKTEFLAKITHELRTPLNGILGNIDLLKEATNLTEAQREYLTIVGASGSHLLSLINELLDISTLESGKMVLDIQVFSIKELLEDIYHQNKVIAENKGLQLILDIDDKTPEVLGDSKRLKQIIINLIGNAIKFTARGTIKIEQSIANLTNENCNLIIKVKDSGIGIPDGKLDYIFEKFSQIDGGLTRNKDGFGLGLAISREIIEAMQGTISVYSQIKKGTTFTVNLTLPLTQNNTSSTTHLAKPCNVLLIEDNIINQKVAVAMLTKIKCSVDVVENGHTALEKFANNHYDIVLTDISLPDIDGCEVTKLIRQQNKDIPIIALSAHTNLEIKRAAFDAGVNDFLSKPITQDTLSEKIYTWQQQVNEF
jgi:PAS domain S-box-containing protein